MTPTPTQVREALELHEFGVHRPKSLHDVIIPAARAWLDLHTECEECDGSGASERLLYNQDGVPQFHTDGTELYESCPVCAGRGYTLQPERLEAAARTICDLDVDFGVKWADLDSHYNEHLAESTRDEYRHAARNAILAYLGEPRP